MVGGRVHHQGQRGHVQGICSDGRPGSVEQRLDQRRLHRSRAQDDAIGWSRARGVRSRGQGMFLSKDGTKFDDIMPKLPTGLGFCTTTLVLDSMNLLIGCANSYKGETPAISGRATAERRGRASVRRAAAASRSWPPTARSTGQPRVAACSRAPTRASRSRWSPPRARPEDFLPIELPDGRIVSAERDDGGGLRRQRRHVEAGHQSDSVSA